MSWIYYSGAMKPAKYLNKMNKYGYLTYIIKNKSKTKYGIIFINN